MSIKEIFKHEALHFTPWLSNNLSKLGSILNKKLELIETEKSIGSKRLDILLKDEDNNEVAIENQYGISDFNHLGKILTYLVGSNANEIIWIAEKFHQVHLDALKWLNINKEDIFFRAISVVNPENNKEKNQEKIFFTEPIVYGDVKEGDILDALNCEKKVIVDKELKKLMEMYESEKPKAHAVQYGVITGSFQYWIWQRDKKRTLFNKYFKEGKGTS